MRVEKFLRRLAGKTDLEDALKKLDRLTQEEARAVLSENLKVAQSVRDEVKVVGGNVGRVEDKVEDVGEKVEEIGGKVEDVGSKMEDMGDKVTDTYDKVEVIGDKLDDIGDNVLCVEEKVQVLIEGTRRMPSQSPTS